jgi:transposase
VKEKRETWFDTIYDACGGDFARLWFLDESGAMTNLVRTHGRCAQGERCVGKVPQGHWKVLTAVAAIGLQGLAAPFTIDCPMDGEIFNVYLRRVLLPTLRPGDVIVMDNLSAHKASGVAELVEAAGAKLLYLPPYSPDFNPIEMIWSKVKRLLRSAAARTVDTLHDAFGKALAAVTRSDILGCFLHCGYEATNKSAPL